MLPPMTEIAVIARAHPRAGGAPAETTITAADLGLAPIDLALALREPRIAAGAPGTPIRAAGADGDLDDRLASLLVARLAPRPDADLEIAWHEPVPGKVSLFELAPLAAKLRRLILTSRPLRPSDFLVEGEGDPALADAAQAIDPARLSPIAVALPELAGLLEAEAAQAEALAAGAEGAAVAGLDEAFARALPLLARASGFGLPQARAGWIRAWLATQFAALSDKAAAASARWGEALARCDATLDLYSALPGVATEEERVALLRRAELEISATASPAAASGALATDVMAARAAFVARRAALDSVSAGPIRTLQALIEAFEAAPPLAAFDRNPPDAAAERKAALGAASDLAAQLRATAAAARGRHARATPKLAEAGDGIGPARVAAMQAASRALFEDELDLAPTFDLAAATRAQLPAALAHAADASGLLAFARTQHLDPVEDWLLGLARVREKAHDLEQARLLAEAFGRAPAALAALQLPHRAGEPWLALQTPPDFAFEGARLALAIAAADGSTFATGAQVCGLMLDDWQETLPAKEETLGLAFHYDQPNSEAPHAWLLAISPNDAPFWRFEDLLAAIHDAIDLAKMRAVTPKDIDQTPYAHFLPAIVSPATMFDVGITNPLLLNILDVAGEASLASLYSTAERP